jgi:hypothetical protein
MVTAAGLHPPRSTTMVSVRDGKREVHDGPYAETKEFLGGFVIIDVPNLDAALEWAARHPAAAHSAVEVRPVFCNFLNRPKTAPRTILLRCYDKEQNKSQS